MHRRQDHFQPLRPEHHGYAGAARQICEQVGVPLPRQARPGERRLVDRRGRDATDSSSLRVAHRRADRLVGGQARLGRQNPRGKHRPGGGTVQDGLARLANPEILRGFPGDLRPDPCRIASGHRDARLSDVHAFCSELEDEPVRDDLRARVAVQGAKCAIDGHKRAHAALAVESVGQPSQIRLQIRMPRSRSSDASARRQTASWSRSAAAVLFFPVRFFADSSRRTGSDTRAACSSRRCAESRAPTRSTVRAARARPTLPSASAAAARAAVSA